MKSISFDRNQYPEIVNLIKSHGFKQISDLPFGVNDFEFLEIMRFSDQEGNSYIVTVYSTNALENDPQVIDIFSLLP